MGKCGKKFKERFYLVVKVKDNVIQNGTVVNMVTNPGLPITRNVMGLKQLYNKDFSKIIPKSYFFLERHQLKEYNSSSIFQSSNYQIYEENTNSTLLFTGIDIIDTFNYVRPDGKYSSTITGATGRFEGATKLVWTQKSDPKDKTKYWVFTVTGYRPKCGKNNSDSE